MDNRGVGIYSEDQAYIVERLKKARKEIGLNQDQVANKLRLTQSFISKIESGQVRISVLQLKKFSELYGKGVDYFIH